MSDTRRAGRRRWCVRQNRVVPTPVAGVKLPVANSIQPDRFGHQAGSDGGKTNSSPGRARHKPSTHCAGNAGVFPTVPVCSCALRYHFLHTGPRVRRAPGIPCSLSGGGRKSSSKPRAHRVARTRNRINRHCEERSDQAIHTSASGDMDYFAALAMAVVVLRTTLVPLTPEEAAQRPSRRVWSGWGPGGPKRPTEPGPAGP
jgi:hypothetical protein